MKQVIARLIIKALAGFLIAHGLADDSTSARIAEFVAAGVLSGIGLLWSHLHLASVSNPLPSPKAQDNPGNAAMRAGLILALAAGALALGGCTAGLQSDKLICIKQRSFGIIVGQSPQTQAPQVHLGFVSTVFQLIPTSTNAPIYAPQFMDVFSIHQGLNPFGFEVTENTGAGQVRIGSSGSCSAFAPAGTNTTESASPGTNTSAVVPK